MALARQMHYLQRVIVDCCQANAIHTSLLKQIEIKQRGSRSDLKFL
jgi:hypothetical protein